MFDHLEFSVSDIVAARRFYKSICQAVGIQEVFFDESEKSVGFGNDGIVRLLLTEGTATAPKMHICFAAQSKGSVEKAYADAIARGGIDNGKPGYRDQYVPGYFAAFVHDADGHNIEILYREEPKAPATL